MSRITISCDKLLSRRKIRPENEVFVCHRITQAITLNNVDDGRVVRFTWFPYPRHIGMSSS